ncbi:MAG: hypothetical protein LBG91_03575 [Treponema sp.]|nr:hypothetical protein [Treponema sp.]
MKNRISLLVILLLMTGAGLFALGKNEEAQKKTQNDEWVLCVTDFDTSTLPEEKLSIANAIKRSLVDRLGTVNYRIRVSPEYAYYEESAWAKARSTAAKNLSAKQNERALYLYRGDSTWKYKQNLAKIDADIEKLRNTFEEINGEAPLINNEPVFSLIKDNLDSTFPQPPKAGGEYKFCLGQKADAFLAGSITDFHGRYFITLKLYTVFTNSFAWEDSIIFSPDDLESALDEIAGRLITTLSGSRPAAITVKVEPEESLVLINRSFAGRGETALTERPPGKVTITALADNYESLTVETELAPGETAEIAIRLAPLSYGNVEIAGPAASVYHGALYVGETPLTLRLPLDQLDYVELETPDKEAGKAVFQTPVQAGTTNYLSMRTAIPPAEGRVDKARRMYYWAWGGTWITGIAAWIGYQTYLGYETAYNSSRTAGMYDQANQMYYVSAGAIIAMGAAVAYEVFHIGRYLYISNEGVTPVVKTNKNGQAYKK